MKMQCAVRIMTKDVLCRQMHYFAQGEDLMKRTVALVLVALLLASTVLTGCSKSASNDTYIVACDAAWPPFEYVDDDKEIVGFDIDLMNAIADEMGFTVEFKNTAWDGIFAGLEAGDYDVVMSAVTIREDRQELYDFTDPYINAGQSVVIRTEETNITGVQDLVEGMVVGAQIGTTGAFAVTDMTTAELKEYDNVDLALLDLVNGNVDAVICDMPVAVDFALSSEEFSGKLTVVGDMITDEFFGALVRKGEDAEFLEMFNEGLQILKDNGTYEEIYNKWMPV